MGDDLGALALGGANMREDLRSAAAELRRLSEPRSETLRSTVRAAEGQIVARAALAAAGNVVDEALRYGKGVVALGDAATRFAKAVATTPASQLQKDVDAGVVVDEMMKEGVRMNADKFNALGDRLKVDRWKVSKIVDKASAAMVTVPL